MCFSKLAWLTKVKIPSPLSGVNDKRQQQLILLEF
jgi:hypothetical protein